MEDLLFLAHRIPYPPNKGDKIRAWHMLKHLTRHYRVHLGCLVDDPHDRQYIAELERHCAEVMAVDVTPMGQRIRAVASLRPGEPLSTGYFRHPQLTRWVDAKLRGGISQAFVYSSPMMAYVAGAPGVHTILDMVDVDSEKWKEMATHAAIPQRWIYDREGRTLLAFERRAAAAADYTLFSTEPEAALFIACAPECAAKTGWIRNGVDLDYFSPAHVFPRPYDDARPVIVFTGDMGYWPNVDAVVWFAREVMPRLRDRRPAPRFAIVGAHPTDAVTSLASDDILVTGRVEDIRPYIAHAALSVAPLQLARGVQNKVLEGMAMGKTVVATRAAEQGLDLGRHGALLLADDPETMAIRICETLDGKHDNVGLAGRRALEAGFDWGTALERLDALLAGPHVRDRERVA